MDSILSAEEFLKSKGCNTLLDFKDEINWLQEFAKLHVEAALKVAEGEAPLYCSEGIKNCYPLENIK